MALLALAPAAAPGQEEAVRPDFRDFPPAETAGEIEAQRVSDPEVTVDWPDLAIAADGSAWAIYVEYQGNPEDRVIVQRRSPQGVWSDPIPIHDRLRDHYWPAIVAVPGGAMAFWSAQRDGNFDIYSAKIADNGTVGQVRRLTSAPHSDFHVRAAGRKGDVTIVWQSFRNGRADIYARRLMDGFWGSEIRVSPSPASDWEPDVALDSAGRAWISWDTYHGGNYDVMLASFDGREAGEPVALTNDPKASFHTSVAVDRNDRVWVVWDEALQNWGKDFSTSSSAPGSEGIHGRRNLRIRVYANGKVWEPQPDINAAFTGFMKHFAELARIAFDGRGVPWVVFRHWTLLSPNEIHHFYATRLGDNEWLRPWRLADSSGRNMQRAAVAAAPDGRLHTLYSSDLRSPENLPQEQMHALHYNAFTATLPESQPVAEVRMREVNVSMPPRRFQPRQRAGMAARDSYTLLLGDCHRHTDVRGHSRTDGSIEDTYRYAIDAAQLDYVGPSDHNEVTGGDWPDGLRDYQWWYAQKMADLMSHPPRFWGLYTYEHSMARPGGHRNMLFLKRGAPLRPIDRTRGRPARDNMPPALWEWVEQNVLTQPGQKTVIVPHTFAAGPLADWEWPNSRFDCLLEIYQGARGSYEKWQLPEGEKRGGTQTDEPGHFAVDALDRGNVYGFVSYSDHNSTHNSWAAVWVTEPTREALFDAMLARRTYAATDEIVVRVSADGHMAGEELYRPRGSPPEIVIDVEAVDEILRIDVIKNGEYVFTRRPGGTTARLSYRDASPEKGRSYYYVRVFQRDPEAPNGDPEIAWASPFFVTYE